MSFPSWLSNCFRLFMLSGYSYSRGCLANYIWQMQFSHSHFIDISRFLRKSYVIPTCLCLHTCIELTKTRFFSWYLKIYYSYHFFLKSIHSSSDNIQRRFEKWLKFWVSPKQSSLWTCMILTLTQWQHSKIDVWLYFRQCTSSQLLISTISCLETLWSPCFSGEHLHFSSPLQTVTASRSDGTSAPALTFLKMQLYEHCLPNLPKYRVLCTIWLNFQSLVPNCRPQQLFCNILGSF